METGEIGVNIIWRGLLGLLAACWAVGHSVAQPLKIDEAFAADIDRHLQFLEKHDLFSGSVLIAEGDRVVFSKGYGFASRELKVPNSPATTFRIASITKQFTAAAVLLLQDRGKVKLDDAVVKHLPDFPKPWAALTVRQLLDHTSGIPSYTDFVDLRSFAKSAQTPRTMAKLSAERKSDFAPGQGYRYNNTAYVVAGQLIETLSGKTYADFIEQDLLRPHGLTESGYARSDVVIPNLAQGYSMDLGRAVPAQFLDMSVPYAGGALYASVGDLHRWNRLLYGDSRATHTKPGAILSRETLAEMVKPGKQRYGLGIGIEPTPYGTRYAHTGGMPGVNTILIYEPDTALTIAVLANTDATDSAAIADAVTRYARDRSLKLAHQYEFVSDAAAEPERAILGRYSDSQQRAGQVILIDGAPHVVPDGNPPSRLFAVGPLHYLSAITLSDFVFKRDGSGTVNALETQLGGKRVTLKREAPPDLAAQPLWLRGSMNEWGVAQKFVSAAYGAWTTRVRLEPGAHQFKIATEDWRTVDFGAPSQMHDNVTLGRAMPLSVRGANLRLWLDDPATLEFRLEAAGMDPPRLIVTPVK
jgi:CubicO group peptidase (beta-lactamase class C family)